MDGLYDLFFLSKTIVLPTEGDLVKLQKKEDIFHLIQETCLVKVKPKQAAARRLKTRRGTNQENHIILNCFFGLW